MDMEEDIKILNEYINIDRKMRKNSQESDYDKFCERQCIAIEHILAEREEDKKRIAELKEYIAIAPNLDEMTATKYIGIQRDAYIRGKAEEQQKAEDIINKNYIPKQKVIDRINYYDERIKHAKLIGDKEQEEFYIDIKKGFYKLLEDK